MYVDHRDLHLLSPAFPTLISADLVVIFLGILFVLASVFGSYVVLGGHMGALYQPFEFVLIAGAALGAYIASNSGKSTGLMLRSIPVTLRASPYSKPWYMEFMDLLYVMLHNARRLGFSSIGSATQIPTASTVFAV